jgi:class 3 adenylate cyclase/tetratricopeptide (TPR) repeat protein
MSICEHCGTENPDGFRFCGGCGSSLPEVAAPRRTRKVVTALFCDVTGSTALGEELDPEVLRGVINRYFAEFRGLIEHHGGTIERFKGDSVMAVFGIPRVREDDALRAVRAAAEIREQLPAVADEVGVALQLRTGLNTGLVLMGEGENLAVGDAVNVAARLEQAAAPGEILLGAETFRLVRDAVEVEPLEPLDLKGKSEPVAAYRLVRVDPVAPGVARHLDAPLVGRRRELHLLQEAFERTVTERGCHLFTLLGAAGVGKSRLVAELLSSVSDEATVLRGRCLPYGEGITFWPLVEALMELGEPAAAVLERLRLGGVATANELFWEVRRLLESLAAERPLILHVDDLQWGEPMLFDLLDHVVDLSRGVPILVLCTARPELLEDRPAWGGGKLNATTVLLEPLDRGDSELLLEQLGGALDRDTTARVIAASEGNPLFLEEMVALAHERGTVSVPSTIQALLVARLERLDTDEREVLERGAVEGEVFHRLAVRALADDRAGAELEVRLGGLVRKELIRPHPAMLRDDEAFRFRHLLIRDAAYDGLPKAARADLHERFATWLEHVDDELVEREEIVGWHLEQAVRYRRELGRAPDLELARRASVYLHQAAVRARAREDSPAARNLLERARALAPDGDPGRAVITVDLIERLIDLGDLDRADELLQTVEGDHAVATHAALHRLEWLGRARSHEATRAAETELPDLLDQLARAGDERGLALAHLVAMNVDWVAGRITGAMEEARLSVVHAGRVGDRALRSRALSWYLAGLMYGPTPREAMEIELDALGNDDPGVFATAWIELVRSAARRLEGRFDAARELARRAIERQAELGVTIEGASCWQHLAEIDLGAGDPSAARESLLRGDAVMESFGEEGFRSTIQALLGEAYERLGDRAAAEAAIELSDRLGADEDAINPIITHRVRARLALADGDLEAAERWARSAVEKAFQTEFVVEQGEATLELARVMAASGRIEEARTEARAAGERFAARGDIPGIRNAETLLTELAER